MKQSRKKSTTKKVSKNETVKNIEDLDKKLKKQKKAIKRFLKILDEEKKKKHNQIKNLIMKTLIALLTCLMFYSVSFGQELMLNTISSAGHFTKNQEITLGWNIGESFSGNWTKEGTLLTEGFYQNFDLLLDVGPKLPLNELMVFPNPATNSITIKSDWLKGKTFILTLSDIGGQKIQQVKTDNPYYHINLIDYKPGIYFLSVADTGGEILAIHKLIKTKK